MSIIFNLFVNPHLHSIKTERLLVRSQLILKTGTGGDWMRLMEISKHIRSRPAEQSIHGLPRKMWSYQPDRCYFRSEDYHRMRSSDFPEIKRNPFKVAHGITPNCHIIPSRKIHPFSSSFDLVFEIKFSG